MNIFVGNLSFGAKEADVHKAFASFGAVAIVAIVMEKKGKKSRGFGFVEMPDEREAQAAIAALNGKELLGRPINVMPALPKKPKKERVKKEGLPRPEQQGDSRHDPSFRRTGKYKEGRRSISFLKRRCASGITAVQPERKHKDNPMRWRKKPKFSAPVGTPKPWDKAGAQLKPWQKQEGGSKPWQKRGDVKPSRFKGRGSSVSHKR